MLTKLLRSGAINIFWRASKLATTFLLSLKLFAPLPRTTSARIFVTRARRGFRAKRDLANTDASVPLPLS